MGLQAAALYALVGVTGAGQSVRDLQGVSNQVNKTQGVLSGLGKNAGQIGKGFGQVGQGLLRIGETMGLAAVGAVVASAKIGTSFQAMTELIHTQAGASQGEVDKMRLGIQAMVHEVGTTPQELAKGLYHIESVGVRGAAALDILKASALGAKVGLADMESVTNALTAVWFSGIKGAKSMTDAMAILDGIVGVGNMHLQDLTDSFKSGILGTAATFGVDIRSLGAAIATLTDAGVPANIAATRLNMTLSHMAAPVPKAIDTLKALGIGQFELANDLRKPDGIFVALQDLHDHLAKAGDIKDGLLTPAGADALTKIFGGSRFGATAMQLLTQMDRVQQKYGLITQRSQTFGDNVKATMQTAGFVWGQFRADIENSALAFSNGFLPALARAGSRLDHFLMSHQSDITKLGTQLGAWVDKIDWKGVENGANSFMDVIKQVLDLISKIPPQIDLAIVGFLGLNKVSGGLLGKGLENIAGGVLGAAGTLGGSILRMGLTKLPVVGGAVGALTAVHVWIDGMNPGVGFGLGGMPGVAAEAEGAAGVFGKALKLLPWVGIGLLIADGFIQGNKDHPEAYGSHPDGPNGPVGPHRIPGQSFGGTSAGGAGAGKAADDTALGSMAWDTHSEGLQIARDTRQAAQGLQDVKDASQGTSAELRKMGQRAADTFTGLPRIVEKALGMSAHSLLAGIADRSMAKYHWKSGKPPESWVMGTFGRDLLAIEHRILGSHATASVKLAGLERLERQAVQGKDWGVAKILKAEIAAQKAQAKRDAHSLALGIAGVAQTVLDKKFVAALTANVNLKVDGNDLVNAVIKTRQFQRAI